MSGYQVVFCDRSVEIVEDADAYRQEGQLTTFFRTAPGRELVDSWSTRLASFRTSTVAAVRRIESASAEAELPADTTSTSSTRGLRVVSAQSEAVHREAHGVDEVTVPRGGACAGNQSSASCS